MSDEKGGQAFPRPQFADFGMTLRDYLAGQAIVGIIASQHQEAWDNSAKAATWAYDYADAMLAAREAK